MSATPDIRLRVSSRDMPGTRPTCRPPGPPIPDTASSPTRWRTCTSASASREETSGPDGTRSKRFKSGWVVFMAGTSHEEQYMSNCSYVKLCQACSSRDSSLPWLKNLPAVRQHAFQHVQHMSVGQPVINMTSTLARNNKPRIPQSAQLVTHSRLGHPQHLHQLMHAHLTSTQERKNLQPGRIRKTLQQSHRLRQNRLARQDLLKQFRTDFTGIAGSHLNHAAIVAAPGKGSHNNQATT